MASTYSLLDYDSEEERLNDPEGPPQANMFAAATYIKSLFSSGAVDWAVMGGFALVCRGSLRPTRDVDVVTDVSPRRLWELIEAQPRMIIPNTRLLEGIIKVFVKTGPKYKDDRDAGCVEEREVEVDLIQPGANGSPRRLRDHRETLQVRVEDRLLPFYGLDLLYMMKTKLNCCGGRCFRRDFDDIKYMLDTYGAEIVAVRNELNENDIESFLETAWMKAMGSDAESHYRALLGR